MILPLQLTLLASFLIYSGKCRDTLLQLAIEEHPNYSPFGWTVPLQIIALLWPHYSETKV